MIGLFAYNYATGKWNVMSVAVDEKLILNPFRHLTDEGKYLFPDWVSIPIKSFKFENGSYSAILEDGYKFPDVVDLSQSIKQCKKTLEDFLK